MTMLMFMSGKQRKSVDRVEVTDPLRSFLVDLDTTGHSSIATRNQGLAAVHSLAAFIGAHSPEHIEWMRAGSGSAIQEDGAGGGRLP
jgi:integrase/recombinase XerD